MAVCFSLQAVELRASSRRARTQTHADNAIGKLAAARQKREARVKQREAEQEEENKQRRKDSDEESEELPEEEEEEVEEQVEQEEEEEEEEELAEAGEEEGYGQGNAPYAEPSEEVRRVGGVSSISNSGLWWGQAAMWTVVRDSWDHISSNKGGEAAVTAVLGAAAARTAAARTAARTTARATIVRAAGIIAAARAGG